MSLYIFNECILATSTGFEVKQCNHIAYHNHPRLSHRNPCGMYLMKEAVLKDKIKYYPRETYCYHPLKTSLLSSYISYKERDI